MSSLTINIWKIALIAGTLLAFSACSSEPETDPNAIDDKNLGIVASNLLNDEETLLGDMPEYSTSAPGSAERIDRAFENAPPMIPHMTDGFFPITKDNNMCLSCHMPDKVAFTKAVAIPESHFTSYRPNLIEKNGKIEVAESKNGVTQKSTGNQLNPARFNCSQCHVPQANVTVDIKNTFEAVFRQKDATSKSNLNQVISEGIK